jgi:hypothetical protein
MMGKRTWNVQQVPCEEDEAVNHLEEEGQARLGRGELPH